MSRTISHGKGNWRNVTTQRINHEATGLVPLADTLGVYKVTEKTADIGLSAAATGAAAAVVALHVEDRTNRGTVADAILAAAQTWSAARGCKRVWDIDIAAAIGFPWTPEGAQSFRQATPGITAPAVPWPSRINETPTDATPRGVVVDPATGRLVTAPDA